MGSKGEKVPLEVLRCVVSVGLHSCGDVRRDAWLFLDFFVCFLCVSIYVAVFHLFLSPGWAVPKCVF